MQEYIILRSIQLSAMKNSFYSEAMNENRQPCMRTQHLRVLSISIYFEKKKRYEQSFSITYNKLISFMSQQTDPVAHAVCQLTQNEDLLEYRCEGGSIEDITEVPENIQSVIMSNVYASHLDASKLSRFPNGIVRLGCDHCHLISIYNDTFQRFDRLLQVSLNDNELIEVRAAWFTGLDYLTTLDFNNNNIENVDGELFINSPSLSDLRFAGNQLRCLDFEKMSNLQSLTHLELRDNPNFDCLQELQQYVREKNLNFEEVYGATYDTPQINQKDTPQVRITIKMKIVFS